MPAIVMPLGVFGVCGRGGVGATLDAEGGPLGVNSLAVGFSENSFAFGFKVDFEADGAEMLSLEPAGASAALGVAGEAAGGGAPVVSWLPGWGEGRGVLP